MALPCARLTALSILSRVDECSRSEVVSRGPAVGLRESYTHLQPRGTTAQARHPRCASQQSIREHTKLSGAMKAWTHHERQSGQAACCGGAALAGLTLSSYD